MAKSEWCSSIVALLACLASAEAARAAQGFGGATAGGSGQTVVHVTTLKDSGTGSLREALLKGNRRIVFDVAGTIYLTSVLEVAGSYVTIDGATAPLPGITIRQSGLRVAYNRSGPLHDIVISNLRIRSPGTYSNEGDGITIRDGVYNILIDHVSVDGATDGSIDITKSAHDVTVQWSVLSNTAKNMLINYGAGRLSLHHNLFAASQWRNPDFQYSDGSTTVAPAITVDVRNNFVWGWGDYGGGTIGRCGGKANVVNNYYVSNATTVARKKNAIRNDGCASGYPGPSMYVKGNLSGDGIAFDVDSAGNVSSPFAAATVATQDACSAATSVLSGAGAQPRDTLDQRTAGRIAPPTCSGTTVTSTVATAPTAGLVASPTSITAGQSSTLSWSSTNATSCTASGGWSGSKSTSGTQTVTPAATATYTLTCSNSGGSVAASTVVSVGAAVPVVSLSATPDTIAAGRSSTLSWSASNATSCTASGGWSGTLATSGSKSVAPAATTGYSLTCSGGGTSASRSATVTVVSTLSSVQGWGSSSPGGSGQPSVHVKNLNDSGPGSLREAALLGNRYIVFDVAGTINLKSVLEVRGSYVTIDGRSGPSPGITLRQSGLRIAYNASLGTPHDVVITNLRIRSPGTYSAEGDGITIKDGVYNMVLDHLSVDGCVDGNIDITKGVHDVTVQWSVLSGCAKNMLINYQTERVSLHHNVFAGSSWRSPLAQYTDGSTTVAPGPVADIRNNLVWGWGDGGGGTILACGAKANVVNNFYLSGATTPDRKKNAIVNDGCGSGYPGPSFYAAGNVSGDAVPVDINAVRNVSSPYSAASVSTQDACTAAKSALAGAGAVPRDTLDPERLSGIAVACP